MNEKIPLKRFAEKVASAARITPEEAEADIKSLFALVAEELRTGQPVKIKGLGEFKLSSDPKDPVVFIPDGEWAAEINAPFAMFEPVAVNPEVSTEELEAIVTEAEPEPEPEASPAPEPPAEAAEKTEEAPEPEEIATVTDAETEIIRPEAVAAPAPAPTPVPVTPAEEVKTPEPPVAPAPTPTPEQAQTPKETPKPEVKLAPWPEEEYEEEEETDPEASEAPASSGKSGFGRGFIVGLIIGLAIGALALCAYVIYYVNADTPQPSLETELTVTDPLFAD